MATPGTMVSPAEVNDLITRVRDLRTHLESNQRYLNMIDRRLSVVEVVVDAMKDAFSVVEEEVEKGEAEGDDA